MNTYYQDSLCTLIQGDCIEVMSSMIEDGLKFDAIITDPPYGTTACKWDTIIPFDKMWKCLKYLRNENTPTVLFGSEPFSSMLRCSNLNEFKYDWIWNKNYGSGFAFSKYQPMRNHEIISCFAKNKSSYYPQEVLSKVKDRKTGKRNGHHGYDLTSEHTGNMIFNSKTNPSKILRTNVNPKTVLDFDCPPRSKGYLHPTQKPVELMEYLIKTYTNEGDIILDFTCGSGTTLVVAKNLNRKSYGIELEEKYCEITKNRLVEIK